MLLFTAAWCNPCKDLKRWMDTVLDDEVRAGITYVDIDEEPELAAKHRVRGIPALVTGDGRYTGREQIKPYLSPQGEYSE